MNFRFNNSVLMNSSLMKRRGRPKLGNVLFARRVSPSKVPLLEAVLREGRVGDGTSDPSKVKALLDDVERLEKENDLLSKRVEEMLSVSESDQVSFWRSRYLEVKERLKRLEEMA